MGKKDVINYSTSDTSFHSVLQKVQDKIESFLKIFSVPHRSICTKIINTRPNFITESLLREGKYDGITRILVRDIIQLYKYQREGEFDLPDAITSDKEYEIPNFHHNFSLRLNLELDDNVEMIDVDGQYFDDESTIEITIKTNPTFKYSPEVLQTLIKELNEVVRHELEHLKQYALGKQHRKEPKNHEKYYSQPDEIEAQRAGFKRRSKQEKIPMEYIVRKWFKDNEHKYKMNPDQIERVIDKILISK
jgi:hypothetical protein